MIKLDKNRFPMLIGLGLTLALLSAKADPQPMGATVSQSVEPVSGLTHSAQTKQPKSYYCPAASSLKLDAANYHWYSKAGWQSYGISFATQLTQFVGAQWDGVNIGQLTCVYQGLPKGTFLVKVVSSHLFYAPLNAKDNHWAKPNKGFINCKSLNQKLCPARPVVKHKQMDMLEQAERLKQSKPNNWESQGEAF